MNAKFELYEYIGQNHPFIFRSEGMRGLSCPFKSIIEVQSAKPGGFR